MKGWTKITNFGDLDAMGEEDWDMVCSKQYIYCYVATNMTFSSAGLPM